VSETTGKVKDLVEEIAAASSEQAQGVEQVNKAVNEMNQVTQQVAASAEESASASEEMSAQSEQMKSVVGQLVTLVGGSHNGRVGRTSRPGLKFLPVASQQAIGRPPREGKALPAPTKAGPEQVIPLGEDEGDLNDF
jgi:methyl-accepting chemotaxis protein